MNLKTRIDTLNAGALVSFDGKVLEFLLNRAFAPGAPIQAEIERTGSWLPLQAKSLGSKKTPSGDFRVKARPINLRRESRVWLENMCSEPSPEASATND